MAASSSGCQSWTQKCSLSVFDHRRCDFSNLYPTENQRVKLFECERPITSYLSRLGLKSGARTDISADVDSEGAGQLIAFRAGLFPYNPKLSVCPYHRDVLGLHWYRPVSCQNPGHVGKMKPCRSVNPKMSEHLLMEKGVLIPVGSGICSKCSSNLLEEMSHVMEPVTQTESVSDHTDENLEQEESKIIPTDMTDKSVHYRMRPRISHAAIVVSPEMSQTSQTSQISNWSEESEFEQETKIFEKETKNFDSLQNANNCIETLSKNKMSPLRSQLTTPWTNCSERTQRYYKRKAEEGINHLLELIAPGQSKDLKEAKLAVVEKSSHEIEITNTIIRMYENTSDNRLRSQLLAIVAGKLSKSDLTKYIPDITPYRVYQAKKIAYSVEESGLMIVEKTKVPRQRMDNTKLHHALSFFMDPCFMQAVSYGTRQLKLDSGQELTIPDMVRTTLHSHIINLYLSYCKQTEFDPLGKTSLYKILNACSSSKRTSLQGLDNIAADGNEASDNLQVICKELHNNGAISKENLDKIISKISFFKMYLKTDYKLHISHDEPCVDHCINWLLSDNSKKEFQSTDCDHEHNIKCDRCGVMKEIEEELMAIVTTNDSLSEDYVKRIEDSIMRIYEWKKHIVRTVNQDQYRLDLLQSLGQHQAIIIMDWAMKFLPRKYREKQSEWFGQRGKNWHVTVVICRDNSGSLINRTYTHIFEHVKQDWFAVASILEHTLQTIHLQMPRITEAFLRSDNAGCYHCAPIWLSIPGISERSAIKILRYTYSEAQSGKSYCDAKIAHMRTKMRTYVASGNNILTAKDMKQALDCGSGVIGCQVAVVRIDTEKQEITSHKMKNINSYNDIEFSEDGMVVRQAYNIGTGLLIKSDDMKKLAMQKEQKETGCVEEIGFKIPNTSEGKIKSKDNNSNEESQENNFCCTEDGCCELFQTYYDLENHILVGKHTYELEKETTYDQIRRQWARMCNNVVLADRKNISVEGNINISNTLPMGWALKKNKTRPRFSKTVTDYLIAKFKQGELSGKKVTPQEVMNEMRSMTTDTGEKMFTSNECLTVSQITSYFSRLAGGHVKHTALNTDNVLEVDEDLLAVADALTEEEVVKQLSLMS